MTMKTTKTAHTEPAQAGSVQRIVSLRFDKESCVGAWEIICDDCPIKPHLDALGMKPKSCAAGIQTNMQGAIPLAQCEHYENDSIKSEGETLKLTCRKQANDQSSPIWPEGGAE